MSLDPPIGRYHIMGGTLADLSGARPSILPSFVVESQMPRIRYPRLRRDGRADDCVGLENRCGFTVTGGSNPPLSAKSWALSPFRIRIRGIADVVEFTDRESVSERDLP
jgi:hypothetical protein